MGFLSSLFGSKSKDQTINQAVHNNVQSELDKLIAQAESGDANSQVILANKYFNGDGIRQDKKELAGIQGILTSNNTDEKLI